MAEIIINLINKHCLSGRSTIKPKTSGNGSIKRDTSRYPSGYRKERGANGRFMSLNPAILRGGGEYDNQRSQ